MLFPAGLFHPLHGGLAASGVYFQAQAKGGEPGVEDDFRGWETEKWGRSVFPAQEKDKKQGLLHDP